MATVVEDQFATQSGHWYTVAGAPMYRIVGKNGKERATTLRDARELGLVPSVTTIMQLEAKPQLTNWLIEQGMLACLTLPRIAGESDHEFMARARLDARQQASNAAVRGTYLHGLLEDAVRNGRIPFKATAEDESYVAPVLKWLDKEFEGYTWSIERSFGTEKYGGKIDLTGVHPEKLPVVIDYKCKDFSDPSKKLHYDEHVTQLAAYGKGLGYPNHRCVNLFISSTVPGLLVPIEWEPADIERGWTAFQCLLGLWKARKNL